MFGHYDISKEIDILECIQLRVTGLRQIVLMNMYAFPVWYLSWFYPCKSLLTSMCMNQCEKYEWILVGKDILIYYVP